MAVSAENFRQLRVLHLVSTGGAPAALQATLFMPLLTRLPKPRVKAQVVCLSPNAAPSMVLRQNGVPVHEIPLSRQRFAWGAFRELLRTTRNFRPDVIQAWGHTAQIVSAYLRPRCDWKPKLVWSVAETAPLARNAGLIDRQKLKFAARYSSKVDRIVYASESGASQHRRVGFPDGEHLTIPPGVDATRFKPDPAARRKVREQLHIPPGSFTIGMIAPFQPEFDHATLIKAVGELIKTHPDLTLVLAGHGVQKGNAPLMALIGGGSLSTRVHLLGEWSDAASLLNACDVVCSSALTDRSRMTLVMAMLCGAPCVATGMGAQGEIIGHHGVAIEAGSPGAFVKGLTRVLQLTPERRAHLIQGARKHALKDFVYVRSLQKYLQLYFDLVGREALATDVVQAPSTEAEAAAIPIPAPDDEPLPQPKKVDIAELADPDSLEAKVAEQPSETLPKWRIEQEQKRAELDQPKAPSAQSHGDVLEFFEATIAPAQAVSASAEEKTAEEDFSELLAPEALETAAPLVQKGPSQQPKPIQAAATESTPKLDAAARMRAAAREELKRAAAMSAPAAVKKPEPVKIETPAPAAMPAPASEATLIADELQLELLPDEPIQQASG